MPAPPAYLDECVDYRLAVALRGRGFTVRVSAEEGTTGLDDETQLRYATRQGLVLVSHNAADFRRLHQDFLARGEEHGGILTMPQRPFFAVREIRFAMLLEWAGSGGEPRSLLVSWGQLQELHEKGHQLAGFSEADLRLALARPSPGPELETRNQSTA